MTRPHPYLTPSQVAARESELASMPLTKRQWTTAKHLMLAVLDGALPIPLGEARANLHVAAPNWTSQLDGMAVARLLGSLGYRRDYSIPSTRAITYTFKGR